MARRPAAFAQIQSREDYVRVVSAVERIAHDTDHRSAIAYEEVRMPLEEKERFEIAREIIRHEDGLVNHQVTWLLVLQAFLFGAFVNALGLYEKLHRQAEVVLTGGLVTIGVLGIIVSATAYNTIHHAFAHMNVVRKWLGRAEGDTEYPPLFGEWPGYFWSTGRLPAVFGTEWAVLLVLLLVGAFLAACRLGPWHPRLPGRV